MQLIERHDSQQQTGEVSETVYRGQLMTNEKFDRRIRDNIGGFFSVGGFLSTRMKTNVALAYAGEGSALDTQHVLFQIHIDNQANKFAYANISSESAFNEAESEILFTMGAVFRVKGCVCDSQGVWIVELKLSGEEDQELRRLSESLVKQISTPKSLLNLAKLMIIMGEHEKALRFALQQIKDNLTTSDDESLRTLSNDFCSIYESRGGHEKLIEFNKKMLEFKLKRFSSTDPSLLSDYNNLGIAYMHLGNYDSALLNFNQAIKHFVVRQRSDQAQYGQVHADQKRPKQVMDAYKESLNLKSNTLPHNDPAFAIAHNNIGKLYYSLKKYEKAIEHYKLALQIGKLSLQYTHPNLAIIYDNLAMSYNKQGQLEEALECRKQLQDIYSKNTRLNRRKVIKCDIWIYMSLSIRLKQPRQGGNY
ncbi:unnamed protein product [Rotaria socialis]|uniref:Uncharacterized protein n=1 Tax=Rotaria socialis TaxID=392032 RepID=A0A820WJI2_9BILA|nr:unnamed protein product [Rotaria socialis]